jgi:hypothetical protein
MHETAATEPAAGAAAFLSDLDDGSRTIILHCACEQTTAPDQSNSSAGFGRGSSRCPFMRWWQQHTSASPSSTAEPWHADGDVQHDRDGHEWLDREQNRIHPNRGIGPGNKSASPKHCVEIEVCANHSIASVNSESLKIVSREPTPGYECQAQQEGHDRWSQRPCSLPPKRLPVVAHREL